MNLTSAAIEAAAKAATEHLAMYTFPANFNGGQAYHEEVAERCGPMITKAVLEAAAPLMCLDRYSQRTEWPDIPRSRS